MMAVTQANDFLARAVANNPSLQAAIAAGQAKNKAKQERTAGLALLSQQLGGQASSYGFSWKGNRSADFHQGKMAKILYDKGVRSLSDLGFSKDGKQLINKNTGQVIPHYKNRKMGKDGRAQIGWESGGKGLTNYYVQADAQGNPVFTPKWKSNAPGGIGGAILKYAAPVIGAVNPLAGAAVGAALGLAQGQKFGDIAKGAALNYGLSSLGRLGSNFATANLPMIGNAGITNAIADSLGGAAAGGIRGLATGQNPFQSALTGAATSAVGSGIGQLVGQIPSTGNATLDKFLQAGAQRGLGSAIGPAFAGLFGGSGGINTGMANQTGFPQNSPQNQGGNQGFGSIPTMGSGNMANFLQLVNSIPQPTAPAFAGPQFNVAQAFEPTAQKSQNFMPSTNNFA